MKLSPRQEAAAAASSGGIFVSAAAGSGKTRMLTERFVRLVKARAAEGSTGGGTDGRDPAGALAAAAAITFTEKAAGELAERIRGTFSEYGDIELARHMDEAWVSTIHGLCTRILRRHAFDAGLDPRFAVADEVEAGVLRQEAFERAVRELGHDDGVGRLISDFGVIEVASCTRDIDEQLRSLGLDTGALVTDEDVLAEALGTVSVELEETLGEMMALDGRGATEEGNIASVRSLLAQVRRVDPSSPDGGLLVLQVLGGFSVKRSCRECAKPLVDRARESAARLGRAATDKEALPSVRAFVSLLERSAGHYAAMKDERGVLDFEDLQLKVHELLTGSPAIARRYRELIGEVMVDEFQDTNELQVSVVEAIAGESFASVGDDKQSIYGWRNADIEVFRRREAAVGSGLRFELPENYRSHPDLVRFFNAVFSAEPFWPGSFMRLEVGERENASPAPEGPWPAGTPRIRVTLVGSDACEGPGAPATEAAAVAEHFAALAAQGVPQAQMVLLLRAMTHVDSFESALRARGFDVFVGSGGTYFDTPEAEELEALLRAVANPADDEAFARMLVGRMAGVSDDALLRLRRAAGRGGTLWDAAADPARLSLDVDDERALVRAVRAIGRARERHGTVPLSDLVLDACEDLGYDLALFGSGDPRAWANTLKFARMAEEFEEVEAGDPSAFLEYLALRRVHKRSEQQAATTAEGIDAVRIMTVHGAKGLEFPVVAVAGLGAKLRADTSPFAFGTPGGVPRLGVRMPDTEPFGKDTRETTSFSRVREWKKQRELDESKRVFYVAATRASEALALFGVTDLGRDPDPASPIGWVRTSLAEAAAGETPGTVTLGGIEIDVVRMRPTEPPVAGQGPGALDLGTASGVGIARDAGVAAVAGAEQRASDEPPGVDAATEPDPPAGGTAPRRISYTGLSRYRACGLSYYATYVARVGRLDVRDAADSGLALGSAVHRVLQLCGDSVTPPPERLDAIARADGLTPEGLGRVREAVAAFLGSDTARRVRASETTLHEVAFGVLVGDTVLDGSIDLLARFGDHALVVDYKTGRSEPNEAALEHRRLQSACYALAVLRAGASTAEIVFVRLEADSATQVYTYYAADLPAIEAEIAGIIADISAGVFAPLEAYTPAVCEECSAAGVLCEIRKRTSRP